MTNALHTLHALILEDNPEDAEFMVRALRAAGYSVSASLVETEADYRLALDAAPHVVIADYSLPRFNALAALEILKQRSLDIPFILVSGTIGEEKAVEAMRLGAADYLLKDRLARLPMAVASAVEEANERAARKKAEAELALLREQLKSVVAALPDVVWSVAFPSREVLYMSPAATAVFGRTPKEFYQDPAVWGDLLHPDDRRRMMARWEEAARGERYESEYRVVKPSGEVRWIQSRGRLVADASCRTVRVDGISRDITERREHEQKIAHLSRIHAVLSGINATIVRVRFRDELFREACRIAVEDGGFGLVWIGLINPAAEEVRAVAHHGFDSASAAAIAVPLGPGAAAQSGTAFRAIADRKPYFINDIAAEAPRNPVREMALRQGYRSVISLPLVVAGASVGVMFLYSRELNFFTADEVRLLGDLAMDISFALEHIEKAEKLAYLAYYDEMTGLPNRTLFQDHLERVLQAAKHKSERVVLVIGDIKRLRMINDTLGRHAGDELLRKAAAWLRQAARNPENLARISGDCFAGILSGLKDPSEAAHRIEQLIVAVGRKPLEVAGEQLTVAFTAGAAVYPEDGADAETLLKNAEAALRKAKSSGEAYLFYEPSMHARIAETLRLENRLRGAIEREEFVLHYQPKFDLGRGRLVGLEALIRWNDPQTGLVAPAHFIPLLEETGMILTAGAWALRQALTDYREWYVQGLQPPRVAVNVSPIQLRQRDFVEVVRRAIEESRAMPHALDLEITESLIMQDIESNIGKLKLLRDAGVNIVIDDFGTGYSSLGYLARLPVDALKIDRSFVATMTVDADSMTIVSTIISLAHSLKMKVIAEGVETEKQSRLLKLLKCDQLQGFLTGRPKPASDLMQVLKEAREV